MTDAKKKCFIIMPITTPENSIVERYHGDIHHFRNVREKLFYPAIDKADMEPIPPVSTGSEIIQSDIIRNIETADLVLCDMSILNPNVFFELGIRTAVNRPICLVKDNKTERVPFDLQLINHYEYDSALTMMSGEKDIPSLTQHLKDSIKSSGGKNSLWKHFSLNVKAVPLNEKSGTDEKIDYLIQLVEATRKQTEVSLPQLARPATGIRLSWAGKEKTLIEMLTPIGLQPDVGTSGPGTRFTAIYNHPLSESMILAIRQIAESIGLATAITATTEGAQIVFLPGEIAGLNFPVYKSA